MPTKQSRFTEGLPPPPPAAAPPPAPRGKPRKLTSMSSISSLSNIFSRRRPSNQTGVKPSMSTQDILPPRNVHHKKNGNNKPLSSARTLAPSTFSSPSPPLPVRVETLLQKAGGSPHLQATKTEASSPHQARISTEHPPTPPTPGSGLGRRQLDESTTLPHTPRRVEYLGPPVTTKPSPRRKTLATTMPTTNDVPVTITTNIQQITEPEPPAYWSGRFSALNDRFRNEENPDPIFNDISKYQQRQRQRERQQGQGRSISIGSGFRRFESKITPDERRVQRVFIHLNSLCATEEARDSLKVFQEEFLKANKDLQPIFSGLSMIGSTSCNGVGLLGGNRNRMEKNGAAGGGGGVRVFKKFLTRKSLA